MRRIFLLSGVLLASCSDGARGGVGLGEPQQYAPDEARDPGTGNDLGYGVDNDTVADFARCRFDSDCLRGKCLRTGAGLDGLCATLCGAVARAGEFVTAPCPRGQTCAFIEEQQIGFCTFSCTSTTDCPRAEIPLECRPSTEPLGRFCSPRFTGEDDR